MTTVHLYHGSGRLFDRFDRKFAMIENDYYGGGVAYCTDDFEVAKTYASAGAKKTGEGYVYRLYLVTNKLFDATATYGPEVFMPLIKGSEEDFMRGAGLLKAGTDRIAALVALKRQQLTGKQIFWGLSRGGVSAGKARDILIKAGYDALKHAGGEQFGAKKHVVYIGYDPAKLKIHDYKKVY